MANNSLLVFCLMLFVSGSWCQPELKWCGGESEVDQKDRPFMARLTLDSAYFCLGVLISDQWLLSPAHCLAGVSKIEVVLGDHCNPDDEVSMESELSIVHPDWDAFTLNNDIGLVKLTEPVTFTDTINKAELPNEELSSGEMASISGPGSGSCRPKSLDVRVAPTQICKDIFGSIYEGICVNEPLGSTGGAPLTKDGTVYGLAGFGSSGGCAGSDVTVFTNIYSYNDWIMDSISGYH